jgi:hypothetical protein
LQSAISKIGTLDRTNVLRIAEIKTEFLTDVVVDFNENNNHLLNDLASDEKEWIMERVHFEIHKMIIANE